MKAIAIDEMWLCSQKKKCWILNPCLAVQGEAYPGTVTIERNNSNTSNYLCQITRCKKVVSKSEKTGNIDANLLRALNQDAIFSAIRHKP